MSSSSSKQSVAFFCDRRRHHPITELFFRTTWATRHVSKAMPQESTPLELIEIWNSILVPPKVFFFGKIASLGTPTILQQLDHNVVSNHTKIIAATARLAQTSKHLIINSLSRRFYLKNQSLITTVITISGRKHDNMILRRWRPSTIIYTDITWHGMTITKKPKQTSCVMHFTGNINPLYVCIIDAEVSWMVTYYSTTYNSK